MSQIPPQYGLYLMIFLTKLSHPTRADNIGFVCNVRCLMTNAIDFSRNASYWFLISEMFPRLSILLTVKLTLDSISQCLAQCSMTVGSKVFYSGTPKMTLPTTWDPHSKVINILSYNMAFKHLKCCLSYTFRQIISMVDCTWHICCYLKQDNYKNLAFFVYYYFYWNSFGDPQPHFGNLCSMIYWWARSKTIGQSDHLYLCDLLLTLAKGSYFIQ